MYRALTALVLLGLVSQNYSFPPPIYSYQKIYPRNGVPAYNVYGTENLYNQDESVSAANVQKDVSSLGLNIAANSPVLEGIMEDELERMDNFSTVLSSDNSSSGLSSSIAIEQNTMPTASGKENVTNTTDPDVVVTTPTTEPPTQFYSSVYNRTLVWLNDAYTMSILIPVAAGFVIASMVIVVVATCNCIRRRCCRRRFRRKLMAESIKNMKASDRAKLLAESSDEEF